MDRHGKERSTSPAAKAITIVLSVVAVLTVLCLVATHFGLSEAVSSILTPNATTTISTSSTTTTVPTTTTTAAKLPKYAFPDEMKGVWLTAGTDYLKNANNTAAAVKEQIDAAFAAMSDWEFNTLLVPLHYKDKALYPSVLLEAVSLKQQDGTVFDPLAYIVDHARARKMYVYGIVDLHVRDKALNDPRTAAGQEAALINVKEQIAPYAFDGYFLSNFSYSIGQLEKDADLTAASTALDTLMSAAVTAIREHNRDLYVGLLSTGIWAHASVDKRGSKTGEFYEEMTDGRADTLAWVQKGLFNCVMMQADSSTNHPTAPFQNMLEWWGNTVGDIPLYVSHSANTIGSYKVGWKLTDQLAKQYLYCKDTKAWKGSVYNSLTALVKDKTGIVEALKKAYEGTLDEAFLYNTLSVSNPTKTSFTTTSSTVKFEGGGDTNFPLTINGEEVPLTEHGFFTQSYTLNIGKNTFVFSHKGLSRTYEVVYKQTLLQSVSPSDNMTVEGGSMFVVSVEARKGSTVKATLGGQTITLKEQATKEDEGGGPESDFATFSASLTLPSGDIGVAKPLGAVSVTASYNGLSETKAGGTVTIEALPVPTTTTTTTTTTTMTTTTTTTTTATETTGTGDASTAETTVTTTTTVTRPEPTLPTGSAKNVVVITADYAETFKGGTADDHSRPYNSLLPKGTWDYLAGKVYNGSLSYYSLASGKRVYMKDATVVQAGELPLSALYNLSANVTASHTVFTVDSDWYVPMYLAAYPQSYENDNKAIYGIEKYGQTAEYVEVTFHYIASIPAAPDLSQNPLFSKAEWIKGENNTYKLKLTLRKKGAYYGASYVWKNGKLTLSFLNPADISQNTGAEKLKGIRILIDPGHGSTTDKPHEAPFNLDYANTLKEKLESLGATVDMTRNTYPVDVSLQQRTTMANNGGYHLFISIHMDGANGKATGATAWYYFENAYTASTYIYEQMHAAEITYGVGTTQNGTPRASGTKWSTLWLNRTIVSCPTVLLECAFLDNPKDKEALINPLYRDKLMQGTANGIINYFASQGSGV